jgi:membrane protein YqaA with SNARE-associated domain
MRAGTADTFNHWKRYGWAIIFVVPWIPVLGDIIPAIAGAKRYDFMKFMISLSAGKTARTIVTIFLGPT